MRRFGVTVLALLAAFVLVTPAFAGGGGERAGAPSSAAVQADPLGKYSPTIALTSVRATDDSIEHILSALKGETIEKNRFTALYEDQLGVTVSYQWIAKGDDQYNQKMNLSLASGDLPDFFAVNLNQLKQLADANLAVDMKGLSAQYAAPLTKEMFSQDQGISTDAATFDGKLLGIPEIAPLTDTAHMLYIRTDWLKNLNLQPPKTMDDLLKIMAAFTTQDPDGNGKNDTFGLAVANGLWKGFPDLMAFFNGFHADPAVWYEDGSGKLVYGSVQPEMRVPLQKLQDMYKAGEIDPEFRTKPGTKVADTVAAGKVGVAFGPDWLPFWPLNISHDADHKAMWQAFAVPSIDAKPAKVPLFLPTVRWTAVNAKAKHPEAVVKLLNLYIEKIWGKTAEADRFFGSGDTEGLWKLASIRALNPSQNFVIFKDVQAADKVGSADALAKSWGTSRAFYDAIKQYRAGNESKWPYEAVYGPLGSIKVLQDYLDSGNTIIARSTLTNSMADKQATLDKMENEVILKIILDTAEMSAFDQFVADWKRLGGDQIGQELNAWWAKARK